jgi:hypothetical protein
MSLELSDIRAVPSQRREGWLKEPLFHFLVLGLLLFSLDSALAPEDDEAKRIVVGPEVDAESRQIFSSSRGRQPTDEELQALRQAWLDNEVLYREGMALQVHRGDPAIRSRVIFKALSVVEAGLEKPMVDTDTVKSWFEANRAKYDEPPRFDFEEAVVAGGTDEPSARALAEKLNSETGGEVDAGLRVFKGRPRDNLVQLYGEPFAQSLEGSQPGRWVALQDKERWRTLRLVALTPGAAARFELMESAVAQDWIDATMAERRTAAVRELAKKYTIVREGESE